MSSNSNQTNKGFHFGPIFIFSLFILFIIGVTLIIIYLPKKKTTDCVGEWSECKDEKKTFDITTTKEGDGKDCKHKIGDTKNCSDIDCVGEWGACDGEKQTYSVTTQKQGNGKECPFAHGEERQECWSNCFDKITMDKTEEMYSTIEEECNKSDLKFSYIISDCNDSNKFKFKCQKNNVLPNEKSSLSNNMLSIYKSIESCSDTEVTIPITGTWNNPELGNIDFRINDSQQLISDNNSDVPPIDFTYDDDNSLSLTATINQMTYIYNNDNCITMKLNDLIVGRLTRVTS